MKVLIDKSFDKDVKKINDKKIRIRLADTIVKCQGANKIADIKNCKKLEGSKNVYRIRIGNYRAGIVYENRKIIFIRFLHRNRIYDYFPK
ncbi:MAG: type II toxin-antitoxin system RelE family toxin [Bacteroidales bacterium]